MKFNDYSYLQGQHAFLSASKYHWINYDEEKLDKRYLNHLASVRGTELHEFASEAIRLGIKLPRTKKTLNLYINDAIGYKMEPEHYSILKIVLVLLTLYLLEMVFLEYMIIKVGSLLLK